jgi:tryptophanyl-tRNA synthetase
LQDAHEVFLFIADLHAVTEDYDPKVLGQHVLSTAALYLACGLDPQKSTLFVQSHVAAHSQLARLLGSITSVGQLRRMIQFREKAVRAGEDACLSLLDYPVLMAADILLYDADQVPVGLDQKQHLELTRDIAERFNRRFGNGKDVLVLPAPYLVTETAKVMSLTDASKKMSKSDANDASRINLMDPPELIRKKIKSAKTDSLRGLEFDNPARPEVHNLLTIYSVLSGKKRDEVAAECKDMGYGTFKPLLAETIVNYLAPIQARYNELMNEPERILAAIRDGRERAKVVAEETLSRAATAMGFVTG